ncbi:MAG: MarR family transcriptional regulator [Chloroflexota bacterium]|nr:MAG: MarR family transcriptional regulator [Chloroflexota bacterium]
MNHPELVRELERIAVGAVALTARALSQAVPGLELTLPQWRAILIVGETADGTRIGVVATRVGTTVPATSRLLRRLERRGFMRFVPDAVDGRATRAQLTPAGAEVRNAILQFRRDTLEFVARRVLEQDDPSLARGLAAIAAELGKYA